MSMINNSVLRHLNRAQPLIASLSLIDSFYRQTFPFYSATNVLLRQPSLCNDKLSLFGRLEASSPRGVELNFVGGLGGIKVVATWWIYGVIGREKIPAPTRPAFSPVVTWTRRPREQLPVSNYANSKTALPHKKDIPLSIAPNWDAPTMSSIARKSFDRLLTYDNVGK